MKSSLNLRHAFNDLRRNKGVNVALVVILVLSAFMMATGAMVMERLVGSVDRLFEEAKAPHFIQMHMGEYDPDALERFASEHPEVDAWLVEEMIGFDSAAIAWRRPATGESGDLSDSLIDNLFVAQNAEFDFLLDETGAIARPAPGEVYVPVAYQQEYDLRVGDELTVRTDSELRELEVQGFVRDAQMASSLSSSTRFLVAEEDRVTLEEAGGGSPEIIVEYRLTDPAASTDLQRAYESEDGLPKDGPAITYRLMLLIYALGDGLVALALAFASLVLIAIALLNLRFVIRGTLEDEVREIGAMKAIGLPHRTIAGLYLPKYRVMTLLACVIGGALAVVATRLLTRGIQVNYVEAPPSAVTVLAPVLALVFVYATVLGICRGVLGGVRRIQVVSALVHGSVHDERQTARRAKRQARRVRRTSLTAYRSGNLSGRLTLLDLRAESGQWVLIPIVFLLATVLMVLPTNMLSTFESPRFITYMGAPEVDLRADMQFFDDVDTVRADMLSAMEGDDRLTDVRAFAHVPHEVDVVVEGEQVRDLLPVEVGDYSGDTIEFFQGERPGPGQIALSVLASDEYGVPIGDELTIHRDGEPTTLMVSGVYQDITGGGHSAKLHGEAATGAVGHVVYADAVEGADLQAVVDEYDERFQEASVLSMPEYGRQTLSNLTGSFRSTAVLAGVFGLGVATVITVMFLELRLTRERTRMGLLSAIGFSTREIIAQVRAKILMAAALGTVLGLVFTATAGESLVSGLLSLSGLGVVDLDFITNPLLVYAAYPAVLIGAGYLGAVLRTARLRHADKSTWLTGG
ncbi:putative ABC transport system permease protein [Nocardiopsis sp. Huas11]|uniref:FtsX-like permease family protein n=1 Tax=Nocardiopsis sp. Huas11 TaxID=2183912 RepID=UPI000EB2FBC2|nr:FtsX-like permease family protein [Nocardiopsis sp. Huas11]RKS05917.1 putative ABC transport system permease protein [Nocardiopsis sp. Huas11]